MAFTLIASTQKGSTDGGATAVTPAIDTTGADLLIALVATWHFASGVAVSDSKGNIWTPVVNQTQGLEVRVSMFRCRPTVVGSGHTLTFTPVEPVFPTVHFLAFSCAGVAKPTDQTSGAGANAGSLAAGSITPSDDDALVIAAAANANVGGGFSIDGGFTIAEQTSCAGGQHYGLGTAYLIQTAPAAANPSWTFSGAANASAVIASLLDGGAWPTSGPLLAMRQHRLVRG